MDNESVLNADARNLISEKLNFLCWVVGERQRFGVEPSPSEKEKIDKLRAHLEEIDFSS